MNLLHFARERYKIVSVASSKQLGKGSILMTHFDQQIIKSGKIIGVLGFIKGENQCWHGPSLLIVERLRCGSEHSRDIIHTRLDLLAERLVKVLVIHPSSVCKASQETFDCCIEKEIRGIDNCDQTVLVFVFGIDRSKRGGYFVCVQVDDDTRQNLHTQALQFLEREAHLAAWAEKDECEKKWRLSGRKKEKERERERQKEEEEEDDEDEDEDEEEREREREREKERKGKKRKSERDKGKK